jgi:hypothetical protein
MTPQADVTDKEPAKKKVIQKEPPQMVDLYW